MNNLNLHKKTFDEIGEKPFNDDSLALRLELEKLRYEYKQNIVNNLNAKKEEEKFIHSVEKEFKEKDKAYKELQNKYEKLNKQYTQLSKEYEKLRKSKFGRIATKYWELKSKLKKRLRR